MKSLSEKRLIIECIINGKKAPFLVDTGASVGLISDDMKKKYNLIVGRKYSRPLIGAGGEISSSYVCNTPINIVNKEMTQFIFSNISHVLDSIEHETGIRIVGIIGLPQMKFVGMKLDLLNNSISV